MGLDLYADLLAEAAPLLLLAASLLCCKLVSHRLIFLRLGLRPEVARKAAERSWHIAFTLYSLRATAVALSDLGLLHQPDLGMLSLTKKCTSGGSGHALLLPSSRRVFAMQIALCACCKPEILTPMPALPAGMLPSDAH